MTGAPDTLHEVPSRPPAGAGSVFGARLPMARNYAARLAGAGVARGLLGPREADRIWDRHLLNCAVLTDLLPPDARVVDVGSGAGLPGLPMAIRRPDLRVTLVEPMLRRCAFLTETVEKLQLTGQVDVLRGRADDASIRAALDGSDWVAARAVAPLDRLVEWCLPLLAPGGTLLALKGIRAAAEVAEHRAALHRLGATEVQVRQVGIDAPAEPTWVVTVRRGARVDARRR